jgi:hypothetical protein
MVTLSPRLGEFLTKATQTPDLETALWKVLLEYVELKRKALREQVAQLEGKWGMSFEEFSRRCQEGSLQADPYSWEVERDFWAWEKAVTLLQHYETLWAYGHQDLR